MVKDVTPQRILRRPDDDESQEEDDEDEWTPLSNEQELASLLKADSLWSINITGRGVKVAIFDTGLNKNHPHFRKIEEQTNWTDEDSHDDHISHGTFVAGLISSSRECLGFAPDAELHIYRVFNSKQVSLLSWYIDAFNYALHKKINVINFSTGGHNFLHHQFMGKIHELSAKKVVIVSAIGNDGPLYDGTLNNPGDQMDVIGVGAINFDDKIADFSSRGMTTWELPSGYGRLKPDVVTYGTEVRGSTLEGSCRKLSGTSFASPVVTGAVTLMISGVPKKIDIINPSSMKQVLIEGATRLNGSNMFEQGYGKLDILKSLKLLINYQPKVTLTPPNLDMTADFMFPYNTQPIYHTMQPIIVNVTILNGIAVMGKVVKVQWDPLENGNLLDIAVSHSDELWPWTGWMSVHIVVNEEGEHFEGIASGSVSIIIDSAGISSVNFPILCKIIPTPPRQQRILYDLFHSLRFPSGYLPRDSLKSTPQPEWRTDHIHTNLRDIYLHLRSIGYYVEVLGEPFTCFDAENYGTLLIADPEDEFFDEEIDKFREDVAEKGLSVLVFADWYNTTVMKEMQQCNPDTSTLWMPDTGGSNVPALNELLEGFGIELSDKVYEGFVRDVNYNSGSSIVKFPMTSQTVLIGGDFVDEGEEFLKQSPKKPQNLCSPEVQLKDVKWIPRNNHQQALVVEKVAVLGMMKTHGQNGGRIVVFGDSNCLDSTSTEEAACFWLIDALLKYSMTGRVDEMLQGMNQETEFKFTGQRLKSFL